MTADPSYVKQPIDVDVLDSSGNVQGKLIANRKTLLHLWKSFVNKASNDDIAQLTEDLSPTSNDQMKSLLQSLRKEGAEICDDRSALKCKDDSHVWADDSSVNKIVRPKTDAQLVVSFEGFLKRIEFLQKEKAPSGVVWSSSHITPKDNMYREGVDFEKLDFVGKGNSAGYLFGTMDQSTNQISVIKNIMISSVRVEELKALNDLNGSGITPALYFCDLFGDKVRLFMEKIDGMTLRKFMEDHMDYIRKVDLALARRFSLYVFFELLSHVYQIHVKGWTHEDLVASNVMLEESEDGLPIRIIDLGRATLLQYKKSGQKGFLSDIANVVRKFTHLYLDDEFESERDIRKNWKFKVQQMNTNDKDLMEKCTLIDSALKVDCLNEVPSLLEEKASRMKFDPLKTQKEVAKIIFNNSKPESNEVPSDSLEETADLMDNVVISRTTICDTTMDQADGGQLQHNMNSYLLPPNQRMPQNQQQNMSQRNKGGMIGPGITQQTSTILQHNTGMNQPTNLKHPTSLPPIAVISPYRTTQHHTVPEKPIPPLVSRPNQNGVVHMKGGSAVAAQNRTPLPSGEQQQQNEVEEKGNEEMKTESLANTTEKTLKCLINEIANYNKQTTGSAEKKVTYQENPEPTTPVSSAGPGEIANSQSDRELMSRFLKLRGFNYTSGTQNITK